MGEIIIRGERDSEEEVCLNILKNCLTPPWLIRALAMRAGAEFVPELSIVAELDGKIIGYGLYAKTTVEGTDSSVQPAATLALIAVQVEHRKTGVGGRIVRHGIDRCRGKGLGLVFSVFLPKFFSKYGFKPARALGLEPGIRLPDSDFLVMDAQGGLLEKIRGKVHFPSGLSLSATAK